MKRRFAGLLLLALEWSSSTVYARTPITIRGHPEARLRAGDPLMNVLPSGLVRTRRNLVLWSIPATACLVYFFSFEWLSLGFFRLVQRMSQQTWLPTQLDDINLQTNVVTQVVNGPVITSVSVLFASLVGLTISNLHKRQAEIHRSLVAEVHSLRELYYLLTSSAVEPHVHPERLHLAQSLVNDHIDDLFSIKFSTPNDRQDAHAYIESGLPRLMLWSIQELTRRRISPPAHYITSQVRDLVKLIMEERTRRWMALQAVPFPLFHYFTLALLAMGIVVSFLVATSQAEFLFLKGLPIKILWSVLMTSFTALGVVCFDLASPFGGAYHIPHDRRATP